MAILRKVGLSLPDIEECLSSNGRSLSHILRRKEHQLEINQKRKDVIELIAKKENQNVIDDKLALIEAEESNYEIFKNAFPGYFRQLWFSAYQPFLDGTLDQDGQEAYKQFVEYLDNLPLFTLSKEEQKYIEDVSSSYDMKTLKELHLSKIKAIENSEL